MGCLYAATGEKVQSLSLMQHHVNLFARTLGHPPWGLKSPTRRGKRVPGSTPQAAKPSSHLDTKPPHSWVNGASPDRASTGQRAGNPQRQNEPQHPAPSLSFLLQLITPCSHGSASKITFSLHSVVVHWGSLVWKVMPK